MKRAGAGGLMAKAVLAMNGAVVVRALRSGPRDAMRRMVEGYHAVDPFSRRENREELRLLERIPEVTLREVVGCPGEVLLDLRYVEVSGSTPLYDLVCVLALAKKQRPKAVLEFGTFWGSTTVNLARNLPEARIHTIDLPPDAEEARAVAAERPVDDVYLIETRQLGRAFQGTEVESRIVQHTGDTATYDYGAIEDEVSFFLIDGAHTYEYAKSDTMTAFRLASGVSTFVWHDCDELHRGVTRWLGELVDAGLPVKRIEGSVVACLRVDAADGRVQRVLRG